LLEHATNKEDEWNKKKKEKKKKNKGQGEAMYELECWWW
jgi:hypothetical protein